MNTNYDLLLMDIPDSRRPSTGFLEIINKQYHENINSSIYTHFINCEEKVVRELFLNALIEIIEEKSARSFSFSYPFAECEVVTEKGKIDIVIQDRETKQIIIIENKIFHWLHNDLKDYWDHFRCSDENKIGILLTPNKHAIPENVKDYFINITHCEWISKIKDAGIPFGMSNKYTIYISDFINTIEQFNPTKEMNEQSRFYFQHAQKILNIQETATAAHQFLNDQFQRLSEKLGWKSYGNVVSWRNFWDADSEIDTYFTVLAGDLLQGKKKISIVLELYRKDKARYKEAEELLKDHPQFLKMKRGESKGLYLHFGVRDYQITDIELENLADYVFRKIQEDFLDAIIKIIMCFYPDYNISAFTKNVCPAELFK